MVDADTKRQLGQTGFRNIMQLLPIEYQIKLLYLGHDRITHDEATYRCIYELQRGTSAITAKPDVIQNQVRTAETDSDDDKAAKPAAHGGDSTNPRSDQIFRVMITDNHGQRSADVDNGILGRSGSSSGDTVSKPANYAMASGGKRDWMPDVNPAVPFRVVVRKFVGGTPVDIDASTKVVFEIKDPVEEFSQNTDQPKRFLEGTPAAPPNPAQGGFFTKYNRTSANPDVGDDNCPTLFRGLRDQGAGNPGVKAPDVLKQVPYAAPPIADTPPANTAPSVDFSSLTPAEAQGAMNAKFDLTEVDEDGKKIGMADLAFCPPHHLGDNYRFLITLTDDGGQDIRDTQENGADVHLLDDARAQIDKPRAYTTGRFILWKRMKMKLVVLVNRTADTDIDWGGMETAYAKSFIEIKQPDAAPAGFKQLTAAQWIAGLKRIFTGGADQTALNTLLGSGATNLNNVYGQAFFPPHLETTKTKAQLRSAINSFVRDLVGRACTTGGLEPPDSSEGKKQAKVVRDKDSEGFYIMLMRRIVRPTAPTAPTNVRRLGNLLGSSFGDRMFWFTNSSSAPNSRVQLTTQTLSHEMGHAQYLRHGHTNGPIAGGGGGGDRGLWFPAPPASGPAPAAINIQLFSSQTNNQIRDHDQAGAYDCLMSYTPRRVASISPCGMCALTMRFYDRVMIQAAGNYRDEIMSGLSPAAIARVSNLAVTNDTAGNPVAGTWTLREPSLVGGTPKLPDLRVGNRMVVVCVSKETTYHSQSGPGTRGRIDLSCADTNAACLAMWSKSGAGDVTLSVLGRNRIRVTGQTAGLVSLSFARDGVTAQAQIEVKP